MKILSIDWVYYGKEDIKNAMIAEGHEVISFPFEVSTSLVWGRLIYDKETEYKLYVALHEKMPDVVFSVNFFPVISRVCQAEDIQYISWSYDCPYILLCSDMVLNSCNTIYVFDKEIYQKFHEAHIMTVRYMPLAVNVERLDLMEENMVPADIFRYDISFVGSLYLEKGTVFDQIEAGLPDYVRGYLKALIAVQLKIQGYDLIEEMLSPILDDLYKVYPVTPLSPGREPKDFFYGYHIIRPWITAVERIEILEMVAKYHSLDLFSHTKDFSVSGLYNHGAVDYLEEMPIVFKQSRINLNITMRSIKSGIPLRAFDIMGAGGFLLSNYQAGFLDHFVPEEDFVFYETKEDLLAKIDYYLLHEDERLEIAKNGHDKVMSGHTYRHRIREMFAF